MELGKKIKELRGAKGLTQEALSKASGMTVRTVKNLEADRHSPSVRNLLKLAEALQVSPAIFFI